MFGTNEGRQTATVFLSFFPLESFLSFFLSDAFFLLSRASLLESKLFITMVVCHTDTLSHRGCLCVVPRLPATA